MAILNYTTKIDYYKTIGEIQKVLVIHGAKKIIIEYDNDQLPASIQFQIELNNMFVHFQLPARYAGVLRAMEKAKAPKNLLTKEQSVRVAWRIIKDWTEAQMAIVEAELAEMTEVFLPYAITKSGGILYDEIKNKKNQYLLTSNTSS